VLGNVHTPRTGVVTISNTANGTDFGTTNAVVADARHGSFNFGLQDNIAFGTCPGNVTAQFGAATATLDVTIIP